MIKFVDFMERYLNCIQNTSSCSSKDALSFGFCATHGIGFLIDVTMVPNVRAKAGFLIDLE
jgi:hypothetical protein